MTEKMLRCHREFKSLYDRMPTGDSSSSPLHHSHHPDYPDAFTINMAKVLQDGRMLEYYNANDEVEQLIRRLFRSEEDEQGTASGMEEEDPYGHLWNVNVDSLRRRLEQLRKAGQTGDVKTSIPKVIWCQNLD